ncbi:capsid staple protein [Maridesulfovibrio sp. FT414]|uniref:capsid staple protein n=1 Tax=Maridesulfovibrio sp. FT414 TaxID=2979469 RepID=UPI003D8035ED
MKLTDMRLKPEKKRKEEAAIESAQDEFPWGLRITLHDESVSKLGLKPKDMKVGSTVKLEAKAFVCSAGAQPGGKNKSIELQLVKLGIDAGGSFEDGFDAGAGDDED